MIWSFKTQSLQIHKYIQMYNTYTYQSYCKISNPYKYQGDWNIESPLKLYFKNISTLIDYQSHSDLSTAFDI